MISNWVRPVDSELDTVWRHFTAGTCESFRIRVLRNKWEEDICMDILQGYFFADPLLSALGLQLEQVSVDSLTAWVGMYLKQNLTYGCFLQSENGEEFLVAVDVLYVRHIRDELPIPDIAKGEAFMNYMKFIKVVERHIRYPECNRYCNYLTSFGVIVRPNYRNRDIEKNMIELRESVARRLCINVIGAVFVGEEILFKIGKSKKPLSQICKYVLLKELTEEKLLRECELDLRAAKVFPIKIMRRRLKNEIIKDVPLESAELVVVNLDSDEESSESEVESSKSEGESSKPEGESSKPEVESSKPEVESSKLDVVSSKPDVVSSKPEGESNKPEGESSKPEVESSKPDVVSSKPDVVSSKPEGESSKPDVEPSQPEAQSSKLEIETSKLEVESSKPEMVPLEPKAVQLVSKVATLEPELELPEPEVALFASQVVTFDHELALLASQVEPLEPEMESPVPKMEPPEPELALLPPELISLENEKAMHLLEIVPVEPEVALLIPQVEPFEPEMALLAHEDEHFEPAPKKSKFYSFTKSLGPE